MRLSIILNTNAGTLTGLDPEQAAAGVVAIFQKHGHEALAQALPGKAAIEAIERACGEPSVEAIVVGGGDGTVSLAAAAAARSRKTLGILPLGTMNLFARSLGIPLEMTAAAEA